MIPRILSSTAVFSMRLSLVGLLVLPFAIPAYAVEAPAPPATSAATPSATPVAPPSDPTIAAPKTGNQRFFDLHESFLKRGKEGPIGVLFLGDSITEGWGHAPEVWQQFYGRYEPANFGIGGDRTEHVLWRLENGEVDGIKPKVVVLMIGTNNSGTNTAEQIAAADRKIVAELRQKLPESKILLLAVFPRGPRKNRDGTMDDGVEKMRRIDAVNVELAKLDNGKTIRFLNINQKFMVDGKIPDDVMPDQLHPNAKGYQIWAEAMQPLLDEMMK